MILFSLLLCMRKISKIKKLGNNSICPRLLHGNTVTWSIVLRAPPAPWRGCYINTSPSHYPVALELLHHTLRVVDKEPENRSGPLGRSVAVEEGDETLGAPSDTPTPGGARLRMTNPAGWRRRR